MTISFAPDGDIFACGAQVLVNPVNQVGVMGAGLAAQFRARYPAMFESYRRAARAGPPLLVHYWANPDGGPDVANVATKAHFKDRSDPVLIADAVAVLVDEITIRFPAPATLALPRLGCGLGGLAWPRVRDDILIPGLAPLSDWRIIILGKEK